MRRLASFLGIGTAAIFSGVLVGCGAPTGDEPLGSADALESAGRKWTGTEVAALVRQAGFPENVVSKMVCTVYYESGFYERKVSYDSNGTSDQGLFQVNSIHTRDKGCPSTTAGMLDATANANCAILIFRADQKAGGDGITRPWVAYRGHKVECDQPPKTTSPWFFDGSATAPGAPAPTQDGSEKTSGPSTATGATAGTCNREGGFYCGNQASNLKGDPNTLYHCVNNRMVEGQVCTNGCTVNATGVDDVCAGGAATGTNTNTGDVGDTGGQGETGTGTVGVCVAPGQACRPDQDACCPDDLGVPQSCVTDPLNPNAGTFVCAAL
jgi:hypothetical protein